MTASHGCSLPEILPSATPQLWDLLGNPTCMVFVKPWALGCPCILPPAEGEVLIVLIFIFSNIGLFSYRAPKSTLECLDTRTGGNQ